jgi:hypothetical protein
MKYKKIINIIGKNMEIITEELHWNLNLIIQLCHPDFILYK